MKVCLIRLIIKLLEVTLLNLFLYTGDKVIWEF